jgi:hypothetical protein
MNHPGNRSLRSSLVLSLVVAVTAAVAPWGAAVAGEGWPTTSREPVAPLDHPLIESSFPRAGSGGEERPAVPATLRFVTFGDQRALADGEWQRLIREIAALEEKEGSFTFVLDTGDIVENGSHSDQFSRLRTILAPLAHSPYLVAAGNHELHDNRTREARENTARFLSYLDPALAEGRYYYRKDVGSIRLLFLDTNELVYGVKGKRKECPATIEPKTPAGRQFAWLTSQLADRATSATRIVVILHHPFVQSSEKHRPQARSLWNATYRGRRLADILADAGVDLVLTGHTHTYERFRLTRDDGRTFSLVNFSGRPRNSFLWFGAKARRARDIRGEESESLQDWGWTDLERWRIEQEEVMLKGEEANQFGVIEIAPDGEIRLETFFVEKGEKVAPRRTGFTTLAPAVAR